MSKTGQKTAGPYKYGPEVSGVSIQLGKVVRSIYRLNVISIYVSYSFDKNTHMTPACFDKGHMERFTVLRKLLIFLYSKLPPLFIWTGIKQLCLPVSMQSMQKIQSLLTFLILPELL